MKSVTIFILIAVIFWAFATFLKVLSAFPSIVGKDVGALLLQGSLILLLATFVDYRDRDVE